MGIAPLGRAVLCAGVAVCLVEHIAVDGQRIKHQHRQQKFWSAGAPAQHGWGVQNFGQHCGDFCQPLCLFSCLCQRCGSKQQRYQQQPVQNNFCAAVFIRTHGLTGLVPLRCALAALQAKCFFYSVSNSHRQFPNFFQCFAFLAGWNVGVHPVQRSGSGIGHR